MAAPAGPIARRRRGLARPPARPKSLLLSNGVRCQVEQAESVRGGVKGRADPPLPGAVARSGPTPARVEGRHAAPGAFILLLSTPVRTGRGRKGRAGAVSHFPCQSKTLSHGHTHARTRTRSPSHAHTGRRPGARPRVAGGRGESPPPALRQRPPGRTGPRTHTPSPAPGSPALGPAVGRASSGLLTQQSSEAGHAEAGGARQKLEAGQNVRRGCTRADTARRSSRWPP